MFYCSLTLKALILFIYLFLVLLACICFTLDDLFTNSSDLLCFTTSLIILQGQYRGDEKIACQVSHIKCFIFQCTLLTDFHFHNLQMMKMDKTFFFLMTRKRKKHTKNIDIVYIKHRAFNAFCIIFCLIHRNFKI